MGTPPPYPKPQRKNFYRRLPNGQKWFSQPAYDDAIAEWRRRCEEARRPQPRENRFGTGEVGETITHTAPVHGTTPDGPVTAAFGIGKHEGETFLSDGHPATGEEYWGDDPKHHDHYNGRGGGSRRGRYTGRGSQ